MLRDVELQRGGVDASLLVVAKARQAPLYTTDHNLALAAEAAGLLTVQPYRLRDQLQLSVSKGDTVMVEVIRQDRRKPQWLIVETVAEPWLTIRLSLSSAYLVASIYIKFSSGPVTNL